MTYLFPCDVSLQARVVSTFARTRADEFDLSYLFLSFPFSFSFLLPLIYSRLLLSPLRLSSSKIHQMFYWLMTLSHVPRELTN